MARQRLSARKPPLARSLIIRTVAPVGGISQHRVTAALFPPDAKIPLMRTLRAVVLGIAGLALLLGSRGSAQQPAPTPLVSGPAQPGSPQPLPRLVSVRPIEPMNAPLPSEADSARVTR